MSPRRSKTSFFIFLLFAIASCKREPERRESSVMPSLVVVFAAIPPRIDGSLADSAWSLANSTGPFVATRDGGPAPVKASAKLSWDDDHLYVAVEVRDPLLLASHKERDAHLWEQDCIELMVAPEGDRSYFEIEVSPRGATFDTRFDARRVPAPFGHVDWDSKARVAVVTRGEIDDDRADAGYSVEMAIPWQTFSPAGVRARPPASGDEWRANLYVLDRRRDGQHAAAWSPVGTGDFHVPERFGSLEFERPERLESTEASH